MLWHVWVAMFDIRIIHKLENAAVGFNSVMKSLQIEEPPCFPGMVVATRLAELKLMLVNLLLDAYSS